MATVLIFGYGNTLRGDDGIGHRAAEVLQEMPLPEGVEVLQIHQLAPELGEMICAARVVLFLDASREGEAGELRCRKVTPDESPAGLTHQFTASAILELTRQLYGTAPEGWEITLTGESFDLSDEFSPRVAEAMPRFVRFVAEKAAELNS
jgi:hydrogenase maturation protease